VTGVTQAPRLRVEGMSKSFGAVRALRDASLEVRAGEVHALLGANGAGKSTLVKVITGVISPDGGTLELDGEPVQFASAAQARDHGVAVVFQDPPLFPHLDVAENIFVGGYPHARANLVDLRDCHERAATLLDTLGIDLSPHRLVGALSTAEREFVAIARALRRESRLLILDEPTSALTPDDARRLFDVVRRYCDNGGGVIFISHRMEDVEELANRVTIFRDGATVYSGPNGELSGDAVVEHILGAALEVEQRSSADTGAADRGAVVLAVDGLSARGRFHDVSLEVRAGEIVVLAGLIGSGRTEVVETVFGLDREDRGTVAVHGRSLRSRSPKSLARMGVALVPEDRDTQGLVYGFSIAENIAMGTRRPWRLGLLNRRRERDVAGAQFAALSIRAADVDTDVASLSGGNRQKVVLGKWLATEPKMLVLDEPTKGVDVGAKADLHAILRRLARERGMAILIVSSDTYEVVEVADRILVMRNGTIVRELPGATATEHDVMAAAVAS
jgi:rhamnose transport system ATP-binding protein